MEQDHIGTSSRSGQQKKTTTGETHSILRGLLSSNGGEDSTGVPGVNTGRGKPYARGATWISNSSGSKAKTTTKTSKNTLNVSYKDASQQRGPLVKKKKVQDLGRYMFENQLFSPEEFKKHCFARNGQHFKHEEAYQYYTDLCERDFEKKLQQATDIARDHVPDLTYRERLESYTPTDSIEGQLCYADYQHLFKHHGITRDTLQKWFKVLFSDNGKRNTIYMWGKADAGKSTIIRLFDAFYASWEIGRASAQNINSNFWLQDLYEKRLFHCDEIVATPVNLDTLKLLLEGSEDLTTDIKYAKKVQVHPRPVLMATNDPIWIGFSTAYDPLVRRCEFIHVTRPAPKGLKNLFLGLDARKEALYKLYKFCFPDGYETWKMDTEMYETVFDETKRERNVKSMSPEETI